ncbi:translocation/assembly module TamB domain-containing protein [Granulosicoccaceae sp. 1_MG-2023]|nr:translocation/assembly module TamB domain-containing protein [Granulosicoccaceae sp. 1_MG-2023]
MKFLHHTLRIALTTVLGLCAITLCLAAWFLGTTEGARQLALIASTRLPQLELQLNGGSVLGGLQAGRLSWQSDTLDAELLDLQIQWQPQCLLQRRLCLDSLQASELTLRPRQADNAPRTARSGALQLPAIDLPLALELDHLQLDSLRLDLQEGREPLQIRDIVLSATARDSALQINTLSAAYKDYRLAADGTLSLQDNYPLSLGVGAVLALPGLADHTPLTIDGRLEGDLQNLTLNAASGGPFHTTLIAQADALAASLPLRAALRWKQLQWPPQGTPQAQAGAGVLTVDGTLDSYTTTLRSQLSAGPVNDAGIRLDGRLNRQGFSADELEITALDGALHGSAELNWQDGIDWQSRLWFENINPAPLAADYPGTLHGSLLGRGELRDGGFTLTLAPFVVQGELRGFPVHLSGRAAHTLPDRWELSDLQLISQDNRLTLEASLAGQLQARGTIEAGALQQLLPEAAGDLSGKFLVSGPAQRPDIELQLNGGTLSYRDISLRAPALEAKLRAAGHEATQLHFHSDSLKRGKHELSDIALTLRGTLAEHLAQLSLNGPQDSSANLQLSGGLGKDKLWQGLLDDAQLVLPAHTLTLTGPAPLHYAPAQKTLTMPAHCWQSQDARLCLDETLQAGPAGSLQASLQGYDLSRLNALLPEHTSLRGPARAQLNLSWDNTQAQPAQLQLQAGISDGRISRRDPLSGEAVNFDFRSLTLNSHTENGLIQNQLQLSSADLGDATGDLTLDPGAVGGIRIERGEVDIDGVDLAVLAAFFPDIDKLTGTLSAEGSLSGPLTAVDFDGRILLDNPQLSSSSLPLSIDGGRVQARINGDRAVIAGKLISGHGEIAVRGQADWRERSDWRSEIQLQGQSLAIRRNPVVDSVMGTDLRLNFSPGKLHIGGEINVLAAAINIREIPAGATRPSADVVIVDSQGDVQSDNSALQISTDVKVILGAGVRLSGYGLNAELGGDFRVVQDANQPLQLYGEITVPKGIYKSYGQDLTVEDGVILLIGPVAQTTLDIEAYREVDNVKAGLQITGNIDAPVITLYSEPDMADERILAFIVLGRDIDAGDDNDSNILATAALSMGIANGRALATDIAETFGIRDFNIEASGRGEDTQVLLSGRLSQNLLVRYGVGVFSSVNTLYLRYELTRRLYLETAQGVERAVDLFYSFDF